jgi:coenzyme F420-reducing hydrogenase delta subunit/Pyruvate/2-oxoacid:ferredoxin oxidoreductase delta subunit
MTVRQRAFSIWQAAESRLDRAFGAEANPLRRLGALAFMLFWVAAASGVYLYVFFDTSAAQAWRSVETISREQWPLGGVMRGLHRYASDALVVVVFAHLLREVLAGHARGFRWFSWISGVPLIVLLYASGIGGYWLVWDQLALFSVTATAEWLDWIGIASEPFARNFFSSDRVIDRLFSLFIFLHIGIPLALLLGMWVHLQRVSRPESFPSRSLAAGTVIALVVLAAGWPVQSQPQADPAQVPATLALDWFYLFPHPVMYATSPGALWAIVTGAMVLLLVLPWLGRDARLPVAVVSAEDCNGCGRCFTDCPYSAIVLVPHTSKRKAPRADRTAAPRMAEVQPALCAGCGICAGACPSSTPFRGSDAFASGIDMPGRRIADLRGELERALGGLSAGPRIVVFGCDRCADVAAARSADTAALSLICAGMLPPSFVEYALRNGADGVLVTGCAAGACDYRFGQRWLEERFAGTREPHLRGNVPRQRLRVAWAGNGSLPELARNVAAFRASLEARVPGDGSIARPKRASRASHA